MFLKRFHFLQLRNFTIIKRAELYRRCYEILGIPDSSDQNTVRRAYIEIVKKVHPDSGHPEASAEKFQEVDECFKLLMEKYAKNRRNIELDPDDDVKVFDIRHTAPQHRQFLTYGGFGIGTPFQREKQYQQRRAMKAQENVLEHRLQKSIASEGALIKKGGGDHFKKHAIKTKYGFDRVVEDLIQEAMNKGDFNNLSGAGKPLKDLQSQNPYVDFTTHKMNKILIDNGFTPAWILLHKEIRVDIDELKECLKKERSKFHNPLELHETFFWDKTLKKAQENVTKINKKIDNFNLIVPTMSKQMTHIQLNSIAEKILNTKPDHGFPTIEEPNKSQQPADNKTDLFSLINFIMK
ncbi:CLUMA_CG007006, isoform A [Clunio marinus]|uniref:CLUMA_CG007006, isoform A n=1 Tax=Clunio marinus TaxID=568069 RepID=A0A1J1I3N3_9DIPT|nr:CLUMA_CG007006, isoform A [Clunio marinus]